MNKTTLAAGREAFAFVGFFGKTGFVVTTMAFALLAPCAHADCLDDAAQYHRVNATLLRAIAVNESGMNPRALNFNANGTYDIGLMQINTSWLPTLRKWGITQTSLYDACVNAYIGAWILEQNIARYGLTWEAVGAYNAASPDKRLKYANRIYHRLMQFSGAVSTAAAWSNAQPVITGPRPQAGSQQASRTRTPAAFSSTRRNPADAGTSPVTASITSLVAWEATDE